jgi:protein-tyrosine kinase
MSAPALERAKVSDKVSQVTVLPTRESYTFGPSLVMLSTPGAAATEAIRALRTHVVAQHLNEGRRALAICGASADVGCTFIATNLAVALAQIGVKTLLVDGDLRRSSLRQFIEPSQDKSGLAQCLASDDVSFNDVIDADVLPNLSIVFSGGPTGAAQELLGGDRFKRAVESYLRDFDATIIDTPPANICADARRISSVVGYSLLVTRRNKSFIDDIKTFASQLEGDGAKVVGTVLNEG